jgi:putative peptidoglycan lipid II flippase
MPIVGGLLLAGAEGFAWGTLVGAVIGQWVVPVVALRRLPGAVGRIRIHPFDGDFREYVWLALPLMLGLGLATVDEWYEKWFGGQLHAGAIAAITYARKLMMAPVGVVGQAVGAALLPTLTILFQRDDREAFDRTLTTTLRATLGLGILAGGALAVLRYPIIQLLYQHGRFSAANTSEVAGLLLILSIAVPGWVVQQVAVRGFYARGEMWRAMTLSTFVALSVFPLYWWGSRAEGIRGLAMASALAISLNAVITLGWLRVRTGGPKLMSLVEAFGRTAVVALPAAGGTMVLLDWLVGRVEAPIVLLLSGGGLYALMTVAGIAFFGDAPLRDALAAIIKRLRP